MSKLMRKNAAEARSQLPALLADAEKGRVTIITRHGRSIAAIVPVTQRATRQQPLTALAELQRQGLIQHIGLSNVTARQVEDARRLCAIVCVQNHYNLVHRNDDALVRQLAGVGIAYVPFFPLGGFTPLQSSALSEVASQLGATPMQVALAWLLQRSPNLVLIPGTSSVQHLRENLAAAELRLPEEAVGRLDRMAEIAPHA